MHAVNDVVKVLVGKDKSIKVIKVTLKRDRYHISKVYTVK